jgi:hypothetical protein
MLNFEMMDATDSNAKIVIKKSILQNQKFEVLFDIGAHSKLQHELRDGLNQTLCKNMSS